MKEKQTFKDLRNEGRLGLFEVKRHVLDSAPLELLRLIMASMVVVRAEFLYSRNSMVYEAFSPEFDETPEGMKPPTYDATITTHRDEEGNVTGYEVAWRRA